MVDHECIQGDSFGYDFSSTGVDFSTGWTGKWALLDKLGASGISAANGTLTPSATGDAMELRILPVDTNAVDVGTYMIVVELSNTSIGFNREVMQDKFEIQNQGNL